MAVITNPGSDETDRGRLTRAGFDRFRWGRLAAGGILFLAITVGIFWYQFSRIGAGEPVPQGRELLWGYLPLIILMLPCEALLAALRIWLICRVLQPGVSYGTCVKAELANVGVAVLTPSQTGGGPGQIYLLNRGGVTLGTALSVSLLSFVGTMVALAGMGVFTLIDAGGDRLHPLFSGAAAALSLVAAAIVAGALFPDALRRAISGCSRLFWRIRGSSGPLREWRPAVDRGTGAPIDRMGPFAARLADMVYTYRDDMARFLRKGKAVFAVTCVLTVLFFFSRFILAFLCVRFLGIRDHSMGEIIRNQMALLFVTYLGPTPGSAGIAEGASMAIMADIVPAGYAPYYHLLWRSSTTYVAAATGLLVLSHAVLRDIGRRRRGAKPTG